MATIVDSAADAAALIRPDDKVGIGLGPQHPPTLLHALGDRDDWDGLEINGALLTDLYAVFTNSRVRFLSGFFGPAERFLVASGANVEYVPGDFRRFGPILESVAPRVMAVATAPPDADGYLSFSLHAGATIPEIERCAADPERLLIIEYSDAFPRTIGLPPEHPHRIHIDDVDVAFESDGQPVNLPDAEGTEVDNTIAELAAGFIPDGATLQTGIGAIPSLIATILAEGSGGGYGVHSEMFTNGLMRLHQAGKVTNADKGEFDGYSITTFAAGTPELYSWLRDNDSVRFLPVEVVNDSQMIAHNRHFVSINGAMGVDLYGQVAADTVGGTQHSGTGGHEDFIAGAGLRLEDRSLICLHSTANGPDGPISRIMPNVGPSMTVTTPRHQVDVVVTEYGVAELQGLTVRERAAAMVEVAHPVFRDELAEAAERI
ncbi:MAG: 4-hydroxybutyrate CoA-transferase [Microthrixaceae bacterium]|nr:acetyl-CoA hydrolase/transferase family protein [Microthrixaceae bacterium]MCO5317987.1 4-hydroxybutyrate CoA-transferase [Microthrixaceae bacterium]